MQIVIPMAGAGQRFRDAGYSRSKPFIPVSGLPMVVRAAQDLPPADRSIFVCRREHLRDDHAENVLSHHFPGCHIVVAPALTEGQACTVRLAAPHLHPDEPVLVAACDNTHVYDSDEFLRRCQNPRLDALIWTYRGEPRVLVAPHMYGWVKTVDQLALDVSVKRPISQHPLGDHVVSGTFWFRRAGAMLDAIDELVETNTRINGEFYLDSVPNALLKHGGLVEVFETRKYIGWGTPADLLDYERWETYFRRTLACAGSPEPLSPTASISAADHGLLSPGGGGDGVSIIPGTVPPTC